MAYIKQTWQNNPPSATTPISASRLDHLETQYDEALAQVAADIAEPASPIGSQLNATVVDEVTAQTAGISSDITSLQAQVNTKADAAAIVIDGVVTEALLPNMPPGIYIVEP